VKNASRNELINFKRRVFEDEFGKFKLENEAIIRSIYGICIHVHSSNTLEKEAKQYYFEILYHQLSIPEINFIFYGFFSSEGLYNPQFEQILASFLKTIEEKKLFIPSDINFLDEIPEPNPE
jgi:type IV secretory pathway TrbL component